MLAYSSTDVACCYQPFKQTLLPSPVSVKPKLVHRSNATNEAEGAKKAGLDTLAKAQDFLLFLLE
jgi:hypothetical protein